MYTLVEFSSPIKWNYPSSSTIHDYAVDHVWQKDRIQSYLWGLPVHYSSAFFKGRVIDSSQTTLFVALMTLVSQCSTCSCSPLLTPHSEIF